MEAFKSPWDVLLSIKANMSVLAYIRTSRITPTKASVRLIFFIRITFKSVFEIYYNNKIVFLQENVLQTE